MRERATWLEPFSPDDFVTYVSRSLLAEDAFWRGDPDLALAHAEAAIRAKALSASPAVIRPAAVALAARADRTVAARLTRDVDAEAAELEEAGKLRDTARLGARYRARPKAVLGAEGRGYLTAALTDREREVLRLMARGMPNRTITNRAEAAVIAQREGL